MVVERRGEVVPLAAQRVGSDTREDECVDRPEEAQRIVEVGLLVAEERARGLGVASEALGQPCVDRRAERLEVLRLAAENLREVGQAAFAASSPDARAAFAFSATAVNAAGSATARSASDLRSSSMPARWRPLMNWL